MNNTPCKSSSAGIRDTMHAAHVNGVAFRRMALLAPIALAACETAEGPSSFLTRPEVLAVSPLPGATSVDRDASIVVDFRGAIEPAVFGATAMLVWGRWGGPVAGTLKLESDDTRIRFTPERPFAAGDEITVSIPRLRERGSESASTSHSWMFRVGTEAGSLDLARTGERPVRIGGEGQIQSYGAYAGDLNGDGYSDLMVPNELSNDVRVFLNDGSGDYGSFVRIPIPNGNTPSTNEGADFNGDGLIDVAVGNAGSDLVSVFLGSASGIQHAANYRADQGVRGLCVLDVDTDGDTDIVTTNRNGAGGGNVSILRNDGAGNFSGATTIETGTGGETACAVGDANGDGVLDVFVGAFHSREIAVLLGDGEGGFTVGQRLAVGGGPWMIAAGDVDGDGRADVTAVTVPQNTVVIAIGDGLGGLRVAGSYPAGDQPVAIDLGDLDGDGDLDVVTSNYGSADWIVYTNTGAGILADPRTLAASAAGSCAILHDRDGDGDLDMTGIDEVADLLVLFENRP